ncbi:hypothetical protein CC78DRAFT_40907 [Lojkania enalia]|uniref:Uncharacterized protein n=1 Tax=Lojkania enalia TaxID=147567 RepID=A0A9P4K4I7_9PLEO|nr:hypothetical protein CC78DRAFT_40907 [Didymosphaeria enalia]
MDSGYPLDLAQTSPFLALPWEIRGMIYEELLDHGVIDISAGVTYVPDLEERGDGVEFKDDMYISYPLRPECYNRSQWSIPTQDFEVAFPILPSARDSLVDMTYQTTPNAYTTERWWNDGLYDDPRWPELNIYVFQLSKQIYVEAREFFYGRNIFRFVHDFRIPTALHFLRDRPSDSRVCIRSIEIAFMEDAGPATDNSHPNHPIVEGELPKLCFAYSYYEELCKLMATSLQIIYFGITIETFSSVSMNLDWDLPVKTVKEALEYEERTPLSLPRWLHPLLKIRCLQVVALKSTSYWPLIRRHARLAKTLREHMLISHDEAQKTPGSTSLSRTSSSKENSIVDILVRLDYPPDCLAECPEGTDFAIRFDLDIGQCELRVCALKLGYMDAMEVEREDESSSNTLELEEIMEGQKHILCYSKLYRT